MKGLMEVVPYNPLWPTLFQQEANLIKEILGNNCLTVHHIGSTSVPHLMAKPVIDMIPVVKTIQDVDLKESEFLRAGYIAKGEQGMPMRRFFFKGDPQRTHHMHIWEEGHPEIEKHLLFRDFLMGHSDYRQKYEDLKIKLSKEFLNDRVNYSLKKDQLIREIMEKTGYQGRSMVCVLTDYEKESFSHLFATISLPSFVEKPIRLVYRRGVDIIAAAFVLPTTKEVFMATAKKEVNESLIKEEFFQLIQKWL